MSEPWTLLVASKYLPEYAGAGFRVHAMYQRLREDGEISWTVVCNSETHAGDTTYIQSGVEIRRISSRWLRGWRRYRPRLLSRLGYAAKTYSEAARTLITIARSRPDVIHVLGTSASTAVAIWWARYRRVPLIVELVTSGASPHQPLPGLSRYWRPDLSRGTLIIAISDALRARCADFGLVGSVWSRPNPVEAIADCDYGGHRFCAAVETENVLGCQFHPEKSAEIGLSILSGFLAR